MKTVNAKYFDGHSARQQDVTLSIADGQLRLNGDELIRELPVSKMRISAKLGNTPRLLHFAEGGHCEVNSHADFEALLSEAGISPHTLLSRLENSWRYAVAATLLTITIVIASFYWCLPWMANIAAARIPASVALAIDTHFLEAVDEGMMQASKLGIARQQALAKKFESLKHEDGTAPHQLKFRNSKTIGANAFALPGGTIIITDQLIKLAGNDEEILGVLAHELGHVSERHPLRQLLQSSVVGLAMTWYLGDISNLLAAAPTLLLETSYSRNFERRADRYAARMLRMNNISPTHLADILKKLEASHPGAIKGKEKPSRFSDILSSHPDTDERIHDLRSNL